MLIQAQRLTTAFQCDDDLLAKSLENVLDVRAKLELHSSTWFDSLAAAGLALLAEEKVDWAIVEVGLGGRLDSTNVLDSELCVITNIMLEHQAIIGPGRREIAYEKAGIIRKRGCSVITGVQPSDSEVVEQIMKCADDAQALEPVFVPSLKPSESFTEVNARIAGRKPLDPSFPNDLAQLNYYTTFGTGSDHTRGDGTPWGCIETNWCSTQWSSHQR